MSDNKKSKHVIQDEWDDDFDPTLMPINEEPPLEVLEQFSHQELEEKLTLAEQQAFEYKEQAFRAIAELENYRKRADRDVANAHRYGAERLLTSLLPVLDSLEQALQLTEKATDPAMHEGIELTLKLFLSVLEKQGVEPLNPEGEIFDPQLHEAMSIVACEGVAANTVMTVFQKGYKLNDRVIRPARVIVAK